MKIGLIDVDGHNFPNLALMKISAWHKQHNDTVEWAHSLDTYDRVYMSKVFTFTPDYDTVINADKIIRGGTGYYLTNTLPTEIEDMCPDYRLYKQYPEAYGYLTRGCPRSCPFCIVGQKEGYSSYKVADLSQFYRGQKEIKLLDPNLLACKSEKYNLLQQLVDSRAWVDFTQGLDIRLMDDKAIDLIKRIKLKMIHFAWDREKNSHQIIKNLQNFKKATGIDRRKAAVYVLTNYETEFEFDLYRVYKLKELGFDPYIMIYDKENAPEKVRHLQRWVNNKIIFQSVEKFEDYNCKLG
jgi:hypothetical protein